MRIVPPLLPRASLLSAIALLGVAATPVHSQSLEDQLNAIVGGGDQSAVSNQAYATAANSIDSLLPALGAVAEPLRSLDIARMDETLPKRLGEGRVSERLLRLAAQRSKGVASLRKQADKLGVSYSQGLLGVRLYARSERDLADITRRVRGDGGEVDAVYGKAVMARVPPRGIEALTRQGGLHFADAATMLHPLQKTSGYGRQVSEAVDLVGVDRLHREGMTGRGVKIGIIDFGFEGYSELVSRGEVPEPAGAAAFNQARRWDVGTEHGTGCAEIIADMAPDAELYLAAVDGSVGQIIAAGNWLLRQGVSIINFSGGGHYGPHNGTAVLDRFVDSLVEQGVFWVNAAGNEGASHWTGLAVDRNRNGFVDSIDRRLPDLVAIQGENFLVTVVWDDWGPDTQRPSSTQDIDAYLLVRQSDGSLGVVGASREIQNGRGVPAEVLGLQDQSSDQVFYLALQMKRVTRPVRVHVVAQGASMSPIVPGGSVGIPATATSALAVAAVDALEGHIQPYSSRGPTDDGRTKPEVSGHDNTASMAYGRNGSPGRFTGTSAAAPHVAGFAALLKQANERASPAALRRAVLKNVKPLGASSPNHEYGYGLIDGGGLRGTSGLPQEDIEEPDEPLSGDDFERSLRDILDL